MILPIILHPIVCTILVIIITWIESLVVYQNISAQFTYLNYGIRWLIFFIIGLPIVSLVRKYHKIKTIGSSEKDRNQSDIVAAIFEMLVTKDSEIAYHNRRTAYLAQSICNELKLNSEETRIILLSAVFHDIGALMIDSHLFKAQSLDPESQKVYEQHPILGQRVLEKFTIFAGAGRIVRHHHERWDGQGFPEGLSGEDIPLGSRIIFLAETYDSLVHGLHSNEIISHDEAMQNVKKDISIKFDANIVSAFDRVGITHRQKADTHVDIP
jgi:response regulator RpfG family c-di-GMP phosphodiesterase